MSAGARPATVLATGYGFLEGPRWRDGRLWASDMLGGRVLAFGEDGSAETVWAQEGWMPSGLGWDPAGRLVVCSMLDRRLVRIEDGEPVAAADLSDCTPWPANDLLLDGDGGAYVGDFGWDVASDPAIAPARLMRVDPDGRARVEVEEVVFPNGMVLADGGRTLLVAETFAARVTAFDRAPDGSLSNRRAWADFAAGEAAPARPFATTVEACAAGVPLPDGIALDADGALWIGDAHGAGALRVRAGGEVLDRVEVGEGQTAYAVALGGADGRTLFLCAAVPLGEGDPAEQQAARLLSCRVDVPAAGAA